METEVTKTECPISMLYSAMEQAKKSAIWFQMENCSNPMIMWAITKAFWPVSGNYNKRFQTYNVVTGVQIGYNY